jgi:hypothetical protein
MGLEVNDFNTLRDKKEVDNLNFSFFNSSQKKVISLNYCFIF